MPTSPENLPKQFWTDLAWWKANGPAVQDRRGRQVEAGLIVDLIDVIRGRHSTRGTFPVPAAGDALGQ